MGEEELTSKIKSLIYKITLPIYLWSVSYKTLEDYITEIEKRKECLECKERTDNLEQEFLKRQKKCEEENKDLTKNLFSPKP